jgi:hypothetical protein
MKIEGAVGGRVHLQEEKGNAGPRMGGVLVEETE